MNIGEWIEREVEVRICDSTEFMYDGMESQSGKRLPIIYQPFDVRKRSHWSDRGSLFDFIFSTNGEGKRLLDFGPGDGWPSLLVAPYVDTVVGIDASKRRVEVCRENARRMKIENAEFLHVETNDSFPFDSRTFDGVMAASSLEQTPDPRKTLKEIHRILKTGGCLRVYYEGLSQYRGSREKEVFFDSSDDRKGEMTIYDRNISQEKATMYKISFLKESREILKILYSEEEEIVYSSLSVSVMEKLKSSIVGVKKCVLTHPSGRTFVQWMKEVGFLKVWPTHSGSDFAGRLFDTMEQERRPEDIEGLDTLLRPIIKSVVWMDAPLDSDPMITAEKKSSTRE
jgi:ubiquinone/menaquinone biosynthesis C-methylase UbiE